MAQGFMLHRRRKVVSKAFKTTWNVSNGILTIPSQAGNYNCVVDWGDGTAPTTHTTGDLIHTYTTAGLCQISITGQYNGFNLGANFATNTRLISVDNWGDVGFVSMNYAFSDCGNLASLPQGAITGAENVTGFTGCFSWCTSLTSAPQGLFDNVPNATDFSICFNSCWSLVAIPSGIFDNVPNVATFENCFNACRSLTSVPEGLFDNVPNATDFRGCFGNCESIASVPEGLFDNVPNATSFRDCFSNCTSLTSVPEGLFLNCPNVTFFYGCFYKCTFNLPTTMFNYTALANKQPNMYQAFGGNTSKTGTAYPLWNYITITSRNYCYQNQTSLTNYADIPTLWK